MSNNRSGYYYLSVLCVSVPLRYFLPFFLPFRILCVSVAFLTN